ncbi:MAG TPA: hypothetical protein PLX35_05270 [Cyclobacteriaceae bacterium]|nr:hypothetical protein [Cyclobacteriaceae bacterium]
MGSSTSSLWISILKSGIIVGVLDAVAAIIHAHFFNGSTPDAVFRYVATGLFGRPALSGGLPTAFAGLALHFTVAISWTALFYVLYPKLKFLSSSMILSGMMYGLFIWMMMNFIVVPLSSVPAGPFRIRAATFVMIGIHLFVIGVPISWLTSRFFKGS